MSETLRLLVTGSRDWPNEQAVRDALRGASSGYASQDVAVVHGHCPTGADAHADRAARIFGMTVERHPADWSLGYSAGPKRNAEMVNLGADLCLAFIGDCTSPRCNRPERHDSHGATGCADLAERAGIPTRRIRPADTTEAGR
jgi:hypothetical protein